MRKTRKTESVRREMENEETVVPSEDVDGEEVDKVVCDSLSLATGLLTILPSVWCGVQYTACEPSHPPILQLKS